MKGRRLPDLRGDGEMHELYGANMIDKEKRWEKRIGVVEEEMMGASIRGMTSSGIQGTMVEVRRSRQLECS